MDFGRALTFQFQDPEWLQKIFTAALVSLIPFFGWFFVFGWSLEITRRVIVNDPLPLPHLRFIEDFVRGLKAFVISLVYSLPALVLILPVSILMTMAIAAADADWFRGVNLMIGLSLVAASVIYSLILMFVLPASYAHMMAQDEALTAGLDLKAVFSSLKSAPTAYLLVVVGQLLCGIIASIGLPFCVIGVVLTSTYTFSIMGHLYGQAYREAQDQPASVYPRVNGTLQ